MSFQFIKCHGSGNDFIMLEESQLPEAWDPQEIAQFARLVSDRQGHLGSDGVLIVAPSIRFDGKMVMYNSDGSRSEMCGNGMRCVARFLFEKTGRDQLMVESGLGVVPCRRQADIFQGVYTVSVVINPVNLQTETVPVHYPVPQILNHPMPEMDQNATFTALSIPNPHLISIQSEIDRERLLQWGETVKERQDIFPRGINVSMVKVLGKNRIFVMTNERGCGITQACGTAMSSSAYVSCLQGLCDYASPVEVQSEGGITFCQVENPESDQVLLTGNATYVYQGLIEMESLEKGLWHVTQKTMIPREQQQYEAMVRQFRKAS
ncbi:MAG: diaminopimelate epimerase [SAR324 cluster bacterium]|nr:diaminopimelate epimerase [SAR324 cluster bacterium]